MNQLSLQIYVTEDGRLPTKGSEEATGYDLYSAEEVELLPGEFKAISTGLIFDCSQTSKDIDIQIRSRSGLAVNYGITTLTGTVDTDYESVVKVILINHGTVKYTVHKGDRIAQLVLGKLQTYGIKELTVLPKPRSLRGSKGLGSTGI